MTKDSEQVAVPVKCIKCGHNAVVNGRCIISVLIRRSSGTRQCNCECIFLPAEPPQSETNAESWQVERTARMESSAVEPPQPSSPAGEEISDNMVDEVQRRMDAVVNAAVAWRQSDWPLTGERIFEATEKLETAVDSLLELRTAPVLPSERAATPERHEFIPQPKDEQACNAYTDHVGDEYFSCGQPREAEIHTAPAVAESQGAKVWEAACAIASKCTARDSKQPEWITIHESDLVKLIVEEFGD